LRTNKSVCDSGVMNKVFWFAFLLALFSFNISSVSELLLEHERMFSTMSDPWPSRINKRPSKKRRFWYLPTT
jgi:hypothetical protein